MFAFLDKLLSWITRLQGSQLDTRTNDDDSTAQETRDLGYHPEPQELLALCKALAAAPDRFQEVVRALQKARLTLGREGALKRPPRGFEDVPDGPAAENVKLKSFVVHRDLSEDALGQPRLVKQIAAFAEAALPLLKFGWAAMDQPTLDWRTEKSS